MAPAPLADAREKLQDWRQQHNEDRPRSATGYDVPITPHNPGGAFGPPSWSADKELVMSSGCRHGRVTVANVELIKVEEWPDGQLLFNVCVTATAGKMELPIAIKDQGSVASNETTVLQSALGFAKELEGSVRLRLGVEQQGP